MNIWVVFSWWPYRVGETTDQHRIPGQLTHIAWGHFPDLGGNAVLLHQRFFGEVELERIISGEWDTKAPCQEVRERWSERRDKDMILYLPSLKITNPFTCCSSKTRSCCWGGTSPNQFGTGNISTARRGPCEGEGHGRCSPPSWTLQQGVGRVQLRHSVA